MMDGKSTDTTVKLENGVVTFKVKNGNKKVASVKFNAKTGKLKVTAKKKGTCKITVTCGSKKASITVTVKK